MQKIRKKLLIILILIITLFITQATITSANSSIITNSEDRVPPQYFILLFGRCKKITLNNQTDAFGLLKGDLHIYNERVFETIDNYCIFLLDKYNREIHTKHSLPKEFTLIGFTGRGFLRWEAVPHSPYSHFCILGNAKYMVMHE